MSGSVRCWWSYHYRCCFPLISPAIARWRGRGKAVAHENTISVLNSEMFGVLFVSIWTIPVLVFSGCEVHVY